MTDVDYTAMPQSELLELPTWSKSGKPCLRKAVRALYPQCKGQFSANASAGLIKKVLGGQLEADDAIDLFLQAQIDSPPAGVAGENPPSDGTSHANIKLADQVDVLIEAFKKVNPAAGEEIGRVVMESREEMELEDFSKDIVASEGKIAIYGIGVPMITEKPSEYVPAIDKHFNFELFRASRKIHNVVEFGQDAGDLVKLLLANVRVMLCGPPSVGKTSIINQFAARSNWPVTRFNGNRDVTVSDFVGYLTASNGSTSYQRGPLTRAVEDGHILILDEYDHMPAECTSVLHPILEPAGTLVLTMDGGRIVRQHPNFRIVATANTSGFGDESGLHPNAQVQDAAMLDRFGAVLHVTFMEPEHERDLLRSKFGTKKSIAEMIVQLANDTRDAVGENRLIMPLTHRNTMNWADLARIVGLEAAFAMTVLNKVPADDVAAVAEMAQRIFGNDLDKMREDA